MIKELLERYFESNEIPTLSKNDDPVKKYLKNIKKFSFGTLRSLT